MKTSSRERERKAQLLSLWHQRPDGKRTENDVLGFYGEMERAFPQLLNRRSGGDAYQNLIAELRGHIDERRTVKDNPWESGYRALDLPQDAQRSAMASARR
jgi:hypothetical protein